MQPLLYFFRIPLGVESKQPRKHVIPHGIGPAVTPAQLAAAGDGAVGLQLALEIEGVACIPEEQLTAVYALLQVFGELDVVFEIEVIEAEAAGGGNIAPTIRGPRNLRYLPASDCHKKRPFGIVAANQKCASNVI